MIRWPTPLLPHRLRKIAPKVVFVLSLAAIVSWQLWMSSRPHTDFNIGYANRASTGATGEPLYFYYLYHLNILPLTTLVPIQKNTRAEAVRLMHQFPQSLRQTTILAFKSGDQGRMYLYFVDALIHGVRAAKTPSFRPANCLGLTLALMAFFTSAWLCRRRILGYAVVLLFGSDPWQLIETYGDDNVRGWLLPSLLLCLAINLPVVAQGRLRRWHWIAPLLTGLVLASVRNIRSEPLVISAAVLLCYALATQLPLWKRGAMMAFFAATLFLSTRGYAAFFLHKRLESNEIVRSVGGPVYTGPYVSYHEFWHPFFVGLSDFDTKHGYKSWEDHAAYRYAAPILRQRLGPKYAYLDPERILQAASYDGNGVYPIPFSFAPGYGDVIRDKVLGDITSDPLWYLGILAKRANLILDTTIPFALELPRLHEEWPSDGFGWLALAALVPLIAFRQRFEAVLLASSFTTSLPALLIYSGRGQTFQSVMHMVLLAILLSYAARALVFAGRRLPIFT